ncbi:MAG: DNA polymerase I [Actinobacteria bacterium HGW-Actinobacteria-9]|nr:MAG: DNA polymerase I [Actinobacteria bacterium HGW-Actinobacteria-9]
MTQRTIAVLDGNSLLHRAFHALPPTMTAPDGRPTNAAFGFVSMLAKLVADMRPDGVIIAWDKGRPAFRSDALAQYKAHRPSAAQELKDQFPMVKSLMDSLAVPQLELEGWEADDILGTVARRGTSHGMRILLVTGDRDALQLVDENVTVVSTQRGVTDIKLYDAAAVLERFGVRPDQITDYLGLKGDTSDNIPGVPGVGEKTAAKLIAEYGSLDAVLENAGSIKGKLGENLRGHADDARVSREVATIRCDAPVDFDLEEVSWGTFDPHEVARAFGELRFTTLLDRILLTTGASTRTGGEATMLVMGEATGAGVASSDAAGVDAPGGLGRPPGECVSDSGRAAAVAVAPVLTGESALEFVRAAARDSWCGVILDESAADTLFAERSGLAVADARGIALVDGGDAGEALRVLLEGVKVASMDTKGLVHELCPPVVQGDCDHSFDAVDLDRLFDCGIAAYLLESNRSSYAAAALSADYLCEPLPEPSGDAGRAALEAAVMVRLAPELERRLEQDSSAEVFRTIEMPLVPVLARMERVGVGLDIAVLNELSTEAAERIDALQCEIFDLCGTRFTIDSPKQLSEILFEKLGLPTQKRTKTGFSTDASVLATLAPLHPVAAKIVSYRELTKLKSTYIDALPTMLAHDGRLHTSFNQTVAATGRLSSSNPNLQNIPVRTELGRRIRAAFVPATAGDLIVSADYSQIELRVLAHLSRDAGLIEAFTSGEDFHAATAARVFGVPVGEVEPGMRAKAKAVNFGIVYGQSAHGLADSLKIQHSEAQAMIDRYYATFPRVREYLDETVATAHRDGVASTLYGRKRRIPELVSNNYNLRSFGERTAMNHPMQGTAADIMKLAMIEVDRRLRADGFAARMVLQVHDELVFEAPATELRALSEMVGDAMGGVGDLAVPLDVCVASGKNWAEAK